MFSGTLRFVWTSLFLLNSQRIAAIPAALLPAALLLSSGRCQALGLGRVHAHTVSIPCAHPRACPRYLSLPRARGLGTLSFALPSHLPHPSQGRCPRMPGNPRNSRGLHLACRSSACTLSVPRPSALQKCRFATRSVVQERKRRLHRSCVPGAEPSESKRTTTYIWWQTPLRYPDTSAA